MRETNKLQTSELKRPPRELTVLEDRRKKLGINRLLAGIAFAFMAYEVFSMALQNADWYLVVIMGLIALGCGFFALVFHKYVRKVEAEMAEAHEIQKEEAEKQQENIWDDINQMKSELDSNEDSAGGNDSRPTDQKTI